MTDGFGDLPYVRSGMTFLPIAFLRKYAFSDREGMTTIVIHANHSTVAELKAYEEMIDANRENIVPYSDFFKLEAKPQCMTARIREYVLAFGKGLAARIGRLKNQHA